MKCDRTWAKGRSWFDLRLYETLGGWIYSANSSNRPPVWPLSQMCTDPQGIMGNCTWNRANWLHDGVALDSTVCEIEFRDGTLKEERNHSLDSSYQSWQVCETTVQNIHHLWSSSNSCGTTLITVRNIHQSKDFQIIYLSHTIQHSICSWMLFVYLTLYTTLK